MEKEDDIGHRLNGVDGTINDRGFFERILKEFKETLAERNLRMDERYEAQGKALDAALVSANTAKGELQDQIDALKDFQSRIISVALAAPVVTAVVVYLLTR